MNINICIGFRRENSRSQQNSQKTFTEAMFSLVAIAGMPMYAFNYMYNPICITISDKKAI